MLDQTALSILIPCLIHGNIVLELMNATGDTMTFAGMDIRFYPSCFDTDQRDLQIPRRNTSQLLSNALIVNPRRLENSTSVWLPNHHYSTI